MRKNAGFTLIELITTIAIVGILAAISMPMMTTYTKKAQYTAVQRVVRYLMDGQDLYFLDNDEFYPNRGRINIRKGVRLEIPELAYTFPSGHNHRYIIYGRNTNTPRRKINMYYVEVRADFDFDGNGRNDRFRYITLFRNGEQIRYREFRQYQ